MKRFFADSWKAIPRVMRRMQGISSMVALSDLRLSQHSGLQELGWFRSYRERIPVNNDGDPLPWFTYPAITFIEGRVNSSMKVFEYGSGFSTLWWSKRVAQVVSCEGDKEWHARMNENSPANSEVFYVDPEDGDAYARSSQRFEKHFDIGLIDGADRNRCARHIISALKDDGVIIWDNSDLDEFQEGYDHLISQGFKRIDFHGFGPINAYLWGTSIFYRPNNCMGI
ncbi:MAG TPA: hypothetical protein EYN06_03935 [Myxococcales bacterium]|nr:hypothetical protein [Myxococcales bacterium]